MRIVTRPDFDGVVCAVLLFEAENIKEPVKWVQPGDIQKGRVEIKEGDIIANLPYDKRCTLWFDHHYSNKIDRPFSGIFKIAPSAAGVIFEYYRGRFSRDYWELIGETDKIDSADLSFDEILYPENHPYFLISLTISTENESGDCYINHIVDLLGKVDIDKVLEDLEVKKQYQKVIEQNKVYKHLLKKYTVLKEHLSITDFRSFYPTPKGNRFLVYAMFPETIASLEISYINKSKDMIRVRVGHNIFNRHCNVNIGHMLSPFEGGGHKGAGGCMFNASKAENYIAQIIDILLHNEAKLM